MSKKLGMADLSKLRGAAEKAHKDDRDYKRASNFDFFLYLLVVMLVAMSIRCFVGEPVRVDGLSMYPTLHDNERMIIEKLTYSVDEPRRGDIIVCYYPGFSVSCVKRVIALPGERVSIDDGVVYINGEVLDESAYVREEMAGSMSERIVAQGHVFVMGDNRNHSTDSRSRSIGDIPYEKIVGRSFVVVWPLFTSRSL